MAKLRVLVSSTCYDLEILRSELRPFISSMGYEPVMSEYSDVLFDPRSHIHASCVNDVTGCDMVVVIIGSRFGGVAVPAAFAHLDFAALEQLSTKPAVLDTKERLSVTQVEVLKAVEQSIPVYVFVDEKVMHDHNLYERNKEKSHIIDQVEFPSIQKRETAKYIFEFINFLSHRVTNNSIMPFSRLEEIRSHLSSQWSQMLQRLLMETRTQTRELRRYSDFSERIEDLKAVIMASLSTANIRKTAQGAVQFRSLIGFVSALQNVDNRGLLLSNGTWDKVLREAHIVEIRSPDDSLTCLVLEDGTFYLSRNSRSFFDKLRNDWAPFKDLDPRTREAIVDALLEVPDRMLMLRHMDMDIETYLSWAKKGGRIPADIGSTNICRAIGQKVNLSGQPLVGRLTPGRKAALVAFFSCSMENPARNKK